MLVVSATAAVRLVVISSAHVLGSCGSIVARNLAAQLGGHRELLLLAAPAENMKTSACQDLSDRSTKAAGRSRYDANLLIHSAHRKHHGAPVERTTATEPPSAGSTRSVLVVRSPS
jgi:hypothetical protein